MAVAPDVPKLIGARVRRRQDPRLITGRATYVDDVPLVNPVYLTILRSPHAHARIVSIDASAARRAPGVVDVVAGPEVKSLFGQLPFEPTFPDQKVPGRWPLANDEVRFVGDPVAAVLAESRAAAEDAHFPDNVSFTLTTSSGDVDGTFARADLRPRGPDRQPAGGTAPDGAAVLRGRLSRRAGRADDLVVDPDPPLACWLLRTSRATSTRRPSA